MPRSCAFLRGGFPALISLALLTLSPLASSAQQAPLRSIDLSNPAFRFEPLEHHFYDDVNLYTGSLFGLSYRLDHLELQYDELFDAQSGPGSNVAANFDIKSITFNRGLQVGIPAVYQNAIKEGVFRYWTGQWFEQADTQSLVRTIARSGAMAHVMPTGGGPQELHDVELGIVYELAAPLADSLVLVPTRAKLQDGFVVEYQWNVAASFGWRVVPSSIRLVKGTTELERFVFVWDSSGQRLKEVLDFLNGNPANWRSTYFEYAPSVAGGGQVLGRVVVGAGESGPYPGVSPSAIRWSYQEIGGRDAITSVFNFADIEVRRFDVGEAPVGPAGSARTIYTGAVYGSGTQAPTQFAVEPDTANGDRRIEVTSPLSPNDPKTYTLVGERGIVTSIARASCPNPEYEAHYFEGGLYDRMVNYEVVRHQCNSAVTRRFAYRDDGTLAGLTHEAVRPEGGLDIRGATIQLGRRVRPNGLRQFTLDRTENQVGRAKSWQYDDKGRILVERDLNEGVDTSYSYTFWDTAEEDVSSVTRTVANGRQDVITFSRSGLPMQSTAASGSPWSATRSWSYDEYLRQAGMIDERNNSHLAEYDPTGRLSRATMVSADGGESIATSFSYHTLYPSLVTREDELYTAGTETQTKYFQKYFFGDLPLVDRVVSGGTNTPELTLWEGSFDPRTLRMDRSCSQSDGSYTSCDYFSFYTEGLRKGMLAAVHHEGGVSLGGSRRVYRYNDANDLIGFDVSDGTLSQSLELTYDRFGRLQQILTNAGIPGQEEVTSYEYDARDRMTRSSNRRDGALTSDLSLTYLHGGQSSRPAVAFDSVTGVLINWSYAPSTLRLLAKNVTGPEGLVTHASILEDGGYDLFDRPMLSNHFIDGVGWRSLQRIYSPVGDLVSETDPLGNTTTYSYDSLGRLESGSDGHHELLFEYGLHNGSSWRQRVLRDLTSDPSLASTLIETAYTDVFGRPVRVVDNSRSVEHTFSYNYRGFLDLLTSHYPDSPDRFFQFEYDGRGQVTRSWLNGSFLKETDYSAFGLLTKRADSRYAETHYQYDRLGRLSTVINPDGSTEQVTSQSYTFPPAPDGAHLVRSMVDRGGAITEQRFDSIGRLLGEVSSGGSLGSLSKQFLYLGGRLQRIQLSSPGRSSQVDFVYDAYGRPIRETHMVGSLLGPQTFALGRAFNDIGQLVELTYPPASTTTSGTVVQYPRDSRGRVERVLVNGSLLTSFQYDGPVLASTTLGNTNRTYAYNQETRDLTRVTDSAGATILADQRYAYDSHGRRREILDTGARAGSAGVYSETFSYSSDGMLEQSTISGPVIGTIMNSYAPARDGRLYSAGYTNDMFELNTQCTYDDYGNPLREQSSQTDFSWSRLGLTSIARPSVPSVNGFFFDGYGRTGWYRAQTATKTKDALHVRERGMVLVQRETAHSVARQRLETADALPR